MTDSNKPFLSPFHPDAKAFPPPAPYYCNLTDAELEQIRLQQEDNHRSLVHYMAARAVRLSRSLDRDLATFRRLIGFRGTEPVSVPQQLVAYRILARCKLLADARASEEDDSELDIMIESIRYGSNADRYWASLKVCMEAVADEAHASAVRECLDDIWRVLDPAMRTRTPQHWLKLFFTGWGASCETDPPHRCRNRIIYTRRMRRHPSPASNR